MTVCAELRSGLWHWLAPHPDWTPEERWPREVSSYAVDDGSRLLLLDPLSVPAEILALAVRREPVVVLTAPWHERDTQQLVETLGAAVFTPPPIRRRTLSRSTGSLPSKPLVAAPTFPGYWPEGQASVASTRRASGFRSASTAFWEGNTTTSYSGSPTFRR